MALGKRKAEQQAMWVATNELPRSPGHPFYKQLNRLLAEAGFDRWAEQLCEPYHHARLGRPSIPPGLYFRMIFVGYFEGIASQRGIAWRCSDSRSLAEFLGLGPTEETPDHSSMSRWHARLPLEVHEQVFQFVLRIAQQKQLLRGKTVAVDSTTLEADAAMKSIVRRDTGEDWREYVTRLMREEGVVAADYQPPDDEIRRYDKQRTDKRVSNDEWESPGDPDAAITKMKDGTTHLAYKAEHVVDVETDVVLAVTVHPGDVSDHDTLVDSVMQADLNLQAAGNPRKHVAEVAADKGYHSNETLAECAALGLRTYIPEPKVKGRRHWTDKPAEQQAAVVANRRRMRGARGKRLGRLRSELTERTFAHVCETGGARRCWLHGLLKVTKRYLIQTAARNLGLLMRKLFRMGTPRGLQKEGELAALTYLVIAQLMISRRRLWRRWIAVRATPARFAHLGRANLAAA
jgi:transposase